MRSSQRLKHNIGRAWPLALALLVAAPLPAEASVSDSDRQCLSCHSIEGLTKTLGDGDKMTLHVAEARYAGSVHSKMGCRSCHPDVNPSQHPVMTGIASRHEYGVARSMACRTCHQDIFEAYAGSMHGQARLDAEHDGAPICADCHSAHGVQRVAAGEGIRQACLGCHDNARKAHAQWLPNSGLHLDMVACPACHSPTADRAVDLRLYDRQKNTPLTEAGGQPGFKEKARAIDVNGDGLDSMELRRLVSEAGQAGAGDVRLRGRLEVSHAPDAHRMTLKLEAVRDCETCHQSGAAPYDKVTVSVTDEEGRLIRYAAAGDTLTSAVSVGAVGGFYTAGGTRIRLLDWLVALSVIAGLAIPVTHMSIRRWFRNKR